MKGTRGCRKAAAMVVFATILVATGFPVATAAESKRFTEWGWPLPYDQVSEKSVKWLKDNGYWPIKFGAVTNWRATVPIVMDKVGLDTKRGIDVEVVPFLSGQPMGAALLANKIHLGQGGSFPMTLLIDRKAPVRNICPCYTMEQFSLIIRPEDRAKYKTVADLKGKTVGFVSASGSEFVWVLMARHAGLDPYNDVILKHMTIPDQAAFPPGIDAVLPWAFTPRYMLEYRKNGSELESSGPYQVFFSGTYIREELIQNVPDVVQALEDMMVEALLWARLRPEEATDLTREFPGLDFPRQMLVDEDRAWFHMLKPSTSVYFFRGVYPYEGERVAAFIYENKRIRTPKTAKDYADFVDTSFIETTFKKLGWRVPTEPSFFKAGYTTARFRGDLERMARGERVLFDFHLPWAMARPQEFPEPGDLEKPWYFSGKWYQPAK